MESLKKIAPGATLKMSALQNNSRAFKTKRFSKTAGDALISELDLCTAVKEVMAGQADDLGGGVYKKRINKNEHRSVLLAKGGKLWIYQHLFAKKDTANISQAELKTFKQLAKVYEKLSTEQLTHLIDSKDLQEICNEQEKIQK